MLLLLLEAILKVPDAAATTNATSPQTMPLLPLLIL